MSGITGFYNRDGMCAERSDLERMTDSIAYRGTDGVGVWNDTSVALGHRMLWTTPESLHEKLPLSSESGDLVITADARIDNRDELWEALGNKGRADLEIADSELILSAYRKWGSACPEHLLGDFAFAIWNVRNQTLFCARDHFGVKPFYYYLSNRLFAFASEPKAVLCLEDVPRQLSESRIADYLGSVFNDTEGTFYEEIKRLPPAHSLAISRNGAALKKYWSLDPQKEIRLGSDDEYAERFREIFAEAVSCRSRSAYPVGSMLSGGLDSSSVTCMARDLMADEGKTGLRTYSAVFDTVKESDESPYIDAVLSQNSVKPNRVHGDEISPLVEHERVLHHQDEPLFAFNHYLNWSINGLASSQGVRVMLDGFDGDSTVSHGTGYLVQLARSWKWFKLSTEIRGFSKNFGVSPWAIASNLAWQHNVSPLIPRPVLRNLRRLFSSRRRSAGVAQSVSILHPDLAERVRLKDRVAASPMPFAKTEREAHFQTLGMAVAPYTLEVLDKSAAAFGIEPRYPFFDKRLVEFCLSLPGDQKMHKGWTRMIMRRAMQGILPSDVQWRAGKANLGPGFKHVFTEFESDTMEDVVLNDSSALQPYVNMEVLHGAYARLQSNTNSHGDIINIWKATTLALWLQQTGRQHKPKGC